MSIEDELKIKTECGLRVIALDNEWRLGYSQRIFGRIL
jgi:hypothetical protein